jgi:hypothetical protein
MASAPRRTLRRVVSVVSDIGNLFEFSFLVPALNAEAAFRMGTRFFG